MPFFVCFVYLVVPLFPPRPLFAEIPLAPHWPLATSHYSLPIFLSWPVGRAAQALLALTHPGSGEEFSDSPIPPWPAARRTIGVHIYIVIPILPQFCRSLSCGKWPILSRLTSHKVCFSGNNTPFGWLARGPLRFCP